MKICGTLYKWIYYNKRSGKGSFILLVDYKKNKKLIIEGCFPEYPLNAPLLVEGLVCDRLISASFCTFCANSEGLDVMVGECGDHDQIEFVTPMIKKRAMANELVRKANKDVFALAQMDEKERKKFSLTQEEKQVILNIKKYQQIAIWNKKYPDIPFDFFHKMLTYNEKEWNSFEHDPYRRGMGAGLSFVECDIIWKANKGMAYSPERIAGGHRMACDYFENNGHTFMLLRDFYSFLQKRMRNDIFPDKINAAFLLTEKPSWFIVQDTGDSFICCDKQLYLAERTAARDLIRLSKKKPEPYCENYLEEVQKEWGISYSDEQKEAIRTILKDTGVKVLLGGPGTGKTAIIKALIGIYQKMHPNKIIRLCAPTGRAAQRMEETTGHEATTNHRILEFTPFNDQLICKDRNNPIEADFLIMDEVSMCDIQILSKLLAAVKNATIVFVGDPDQLPSVGPGNVLADLRQLSELFSICVLNKVFRQAEGSKIISNARKVREGSSALQSGKDFALLRSDSEEAIRRLLREVAQKDPEMQVLCPVKRGPCGVFAINELMQNIINPNGKKRIFGNRQLREGDRVILTRNCVDFHYYNGDIGILTEFNSYGAFVQCGDRRLFVPNENFRDIDLAYAITVHKSQGSEFDHVLFLLPNNSFAYRNLVYTGITRAKEKCIICEYPHMLDRAVKKKIANRNSRLVDLVRIFLDGQNKSKGQS